MLFLVFVTRIKDIAILFFASYVIACSLNPLVDKLTNKMTRSQAATLVLCGVLGIIAVFLLPVFIVGGHQIEAFVSVLPEHISTVKSYILSLPIINQSNFAQLDMTGILSSASEVTSQFVNSSINASMEFASALIYLLAGCIIVYYFMADKETVRKAYLSLFPHQMKTRADEILNTISQKIGGYVLAQVVTISSVGITMTVGLLILGVDYALLLGLLNAIFDIIPVVGPGVALCVTLLAAYKMGPITLALILLLFIVAQWAENNLVRPYIFGKFLDLHPLIIYFFLFVTAQYFGVIGVIFAPAIAATVCVLIEELYIKNIN